MLIQPTTELEAVNIILTTIGETSIHTLNGELPADASIARDVLREVSRNVQTKGWRWNTEDAVEISPDGLTKELRLPANCLAADEAFPTQRYDLVQRGQRLYDRRRRSYQFTETVQVEMTLCLDWGELPEAARRYITIKAARVFHDRVLGSNIAN